MQPPANSSNPDQPGSGDLEEATLRGEPLMMLRPLADKIIATGRSDAAEQLLEARLKEVLKRTAEGKAVGDRVVAAASDAAMKLAQATRHAQWVEYTLELHTNLQRVMSREAVDSLYSLIPRSDPVRIGVLRRYLAALKPLQPNMDPAQRFALKRLQGLESVIAAR